MFNGNNKDTETSFAVLKIVQQTTSFKDSKQVKLLKVVLHNTAKNPHFHPEAPKMTIV